MRSTALALALAGSILAGACGGSSRSSSPSSPSAASTTLDASASSAAPTDTASSSTTSAVGATTAATTTVPPVPPAAPPNAAAAAPPAPPAAPTDPYVRTAAGCAAGTDAVSLDRFFAARVGPVMGLDYPHAVPLGNGRVAWFFQDAFVDPAGQATSLGATHLVRNIAALQDGNCFTVVHRGTAARPVAFEPGTGEITGRRWWWPLGSEVSAGLVRVLWVELAGDPAFGGAGLPWSPARTWLGTYRASDLSRVDFRLAPDAAVGPVYGYAVASDASWTYLFANSYQQDLSAEGGWFAPHSATAMYVGRVPKGRLDVRPTYWDGKGWGTDRRSAAVISQRFTFENAMQPRFVNGRWIAVTKVDGFYGRDVVVDLAPAPQGPWVEAARFGAPLRNGDGRLTAYAPYLAPWAQRDGRLVLLLSQNALLAYGGPASAPWMYRLLVVPMTWPPNPPPPTTTTTTTLPPTTVPPTTVPPTTTEPTSTTTTEPPSTTTTTDAATTTTSSGGSSTTSSSTTSSSTTGPSTTGG